MEISKVEDYLAHHGVKGMKWGRRRDRNPNYTDQQVKRDKQIYGNRGTKRINKALNKGDQISVARGAEKTRRDKVLNRNKYVREVGKGVAGIVTGGTGYALSRKAAGLIQTRRGQAVLNRVFGNATPTVTMLVASPVASGIVAAGATKIGLMFGGDLAVGANMRIAGLDPNRKY